jgi:PIN domain nuclease of toxin-antitoxin system
VNLCLDTYAFLWFIANDPRFSRQPQSLIHLPSTPMPFDGFGKVATA